MFFNSYCGNASDTTRYMFDKMLNVVENVQYTNDATEWFAYCLSGLMSQTTNGVGGAESDAKRVDASVVTKDQEPSAPPAEKTTDPPTSDPNAPAPPKDPPTSDPNAPSPTNQTPSPSPATPAEPAVTDSFRMTIRVRRIGVEDTDLVDPFSINDPLVQQSLLMLHPEAISEDVIEQADVPVFGDVIKVKTNSFGQLVWTKITGDNNQAQFLKTMVASRSLNSQFIGATPGLLGDAVSVKNCPAYRTPPVKTEETEPYSSGLWYAKDGIISNLSYHCKLWMDDFVKALNQQYPAFKNSGKYIVVTSGKRSPEAQARAMYNNRKPFRNLPYSQGWNPYSNKSDSARIFDAFKRSGWENDAAAKAAGATAIREIQNSSGRFKSGHMGNSAVDLRTRGLSPTDVQWVLQVARSLTSHTVMLELECRGNEHIHVTIPKTYKGYEAGPTERGEM